MGGELDNCTYVFINLSISTQSYGGLLTREVLPANYLSHLPIPADEKTEAHSGSIICWSYREPGQNLLRLFSQGGGTAFPT